jgi:ribosomal protein S18 acetylase RimI-like enzyme
MDIFVRHYHPTDLQSVFDISADTAFFGDPAEAFLEDRCLYNDAFTRYYIEHEADHVWVAEGSETVIGFLLGCINTIYQSTHWRNYIVNTVLVKALSGSYKLGRRTAGYAMGMLLGLLREEKPIVDMVVYPAHMQIDVMQGYRGMGVGQRLIDAYLEQLRQLRVRGVHLGTTSHNQTACRLYEKMGFQLLESHPNRFWTKKLGMAVNNRSYGLILD